MGKFLKKIQSTDITGVYNKKQTAIMNHYKDQPNNGPTIYAFENPETKATRTAFVNSDNYDDITDFTWRFGYNNGHPCIFIKFNAINDILLNKNAFICLETNSNTKGKNIHLNIYSNYGYCYLSEIELYTEFPIYINTITRKSPRSIIQWRHIFPVPQDWEITLNIRPSIRIGTIGAKNSHHDIHTDYKCYPEYINVTYLLKDELIF